MIHDFIPRSALNRSVRQVPVASATFAVTFGLLALLVGGCPHDSGNSGTAAGRPQRRRRKPRFVCAGSFRTPRGGLGSHVGCVAFACYRNRRRREPSLRFPGLGDPEKADLSRAPDQPPPTNLCPTSVFDQRVLDQLAADTRPARTGSRPAPTNGGGAPHRSSPRRQQWTGFRGPGGLGLGEARGAGGWATPATWSGRPAAGAEHQPGVLRRTHLPDRITIRRR